MNKRTTRKPAATTAPPRAARRETELPAWLPPLVFALATVLLLHEFFFNGGLLLGRDTFALSYFAREFYTEFVRAFGRFPLWNPYLLGGLPFVEGMHGDIFYPPSLALFFLDARAMWGWKMALHIFAAGMLAYLWLRRLRLGRGAALFGGLVYMAGADLVSLLHPGGDGKLFVSALAPLLFLLADRAAAGLRIHEYALFALALAMVMFTSHMQLAYFAVWGVSLWFFFLVWRHWREERSGGRAAARLGLFAAAGVLGVAASAVQFVPPLEYLREWSHRSERTVDANPAEAYAYSTSYAMNAEELVSLVVPEFPGADLVTEQPSPRYWGPNPLKFNSEYAGLVPLLLIPLLFFRRRDPRTWFFAGLGALALLYALGASTPFFRLFYMVPGVRLFRAPSLIIFLYGLSVATLGAFALERLREWAADEDGHRIARRALWIAAGVLLAAALLQTAGVITSVWASLRPSVQPGALADNIPAITRGFWIAFGLAALTAGAWELRARGLYGATTLVFLLCALAFVDLYRADRPFVKATVLLGEFRRADPIFEADATIRFLQQRQEEGEVFRVLDLGILMQTGPAYGPNVLAVHGLEQMDGHHGNEIGRWRNLIGAVNDAPTNVARTQLRLSDMLNVSYLIVPAQLDDPSLEEVFVGPRAAVYRRPAALPRAWLVGAVEVHEPDAALERLLAEDFDPRTTAVLEEPLPDGVTVEPGPAGEVAWTERQVDAMTLQVTTDRPALLVMSDNYYEAWHAEVDGNAAPLLRANYALRAVPVPAGSHTVTLRYRSDTLRASAAASALLLLALAAIGLGGWLRARREENA